MDQLTRGFYTLATVVLLCSACSVKKSTPPPLDLNRGEIALCGSGEGQFGKIISLQSCAPETQADFNLATALLHSFEYAEAEKVFARVIDADPGCLMAYWGAAMCNFHPLWAPPTSEELEKGSKIIAAARSVATDKSSRESAYVEAIATIFDNWKDLGHRERLKKFEDACRNLYVKYPSDTEAAIFYSLALNACADPADKTFKKQLEAGDILNTLFTQQPDHPGITHYLIHNFDYPELADRALPAARRYAAIASASAHAQHMPSHIFTRLGLWQEAIQANRNSISAALCYAKNIGATGHWDEELHGLDYLTYAYLQNGDFDSARAQLDYLRTIKEVFPQNFKVSYAFASIPARYALERKDWNAAATLKPEPPDYPWDKFPWEKANIHLTRLLGSVHLNDLAAAKSELDALRACQKKLEDSQLPQEAKLVLIQVRTGEAWIRWKEGDRAEALRLMAEAADMEDATAKHPVTPGEILPARELLGDLYMESRNYLKALEAYEEDLVRHPNRFNGLAGAAKAAEMSGNREKAGYYRDLLK